MLSWDWHVLRLAHYHQTKNILKQRHRQVLIKVGAIFIEIIKRLSEACIIIYKIKTHTFDLNHSSPLAETKLC